MYHYRIVITWNKMRTVDYASSENYLFVCQCENCVLQADDPDMTSEEEECSDSDEDCMDHSD